ncbi:hypothetical protein ACVWYH_003107 [Bradyrhizobium sp. GM24.11]
MTMQATKTPTTRREFSKWLAGAAASATAATAVPALADVAAPGNEASSLWQERQLHVEALRSLSQAYLEASERLPDWAKGGLNMIDSEGNPCGEEVGWPLDMTIAPPTIEGAGRLVRPSIYGVRQEFETFMAMAGAGPGSAARVRARAQMRERIKLIVARLRERKRLYEELGLNVMSDGCEAACEGIRDAVEAIEDLPPSPERSAALVMEGLSNECTVDAFASGNGYCGTMAIAVVALEAFLPGLSGLIREHAAHFLANRTSTLASMPFTPA